MRFQRNLQYAISLTWILWLVAGCGAPAATPTEPSLHVDPTTTPLPTRTPVPTATPTPALAASSEERISSPDVDRGDLRELADGNNAFAFDLYQAISDGEDNLLYSPYSLSVALAMTYAGARGETEQQMADTLHFTLPQDRLHAAFNALDLELASRSRTFQLNIANAIWGQQGLEYLPKYLDLVALNYGAGIRLVDFKKDAAAAVEAINRWVSEETEGRIQNLVSDFGEDTGLVLANAIYFNAEWELTFEKFHTRDAPFYLLDGEEEMVPMMHQTNHFRYTEGDGYQAIQLPYQKSEVAMVVILPREGRFREIEKRMAGDWVQDIVDALQLHEVILTMPKFRLEPPPLSLKETLPAMGMPSAFSPDAADFSGIIEREPDLYVWIGEVLHKAFIDVDEKRTEAAAAGVVIMEVEVEKVIGPTEPPPIVMKIDRPFIFFIRDIKTNAILFVGRVMNPVSE